MATLTFTDSFFVLGPTLLALDAKDWTPIGNSFKTRNVFEAARFKAYADAKTKRIFERLMLKTLKLPAGGASITPPGLELFDFQRFRGVPHILGSNHTYLAHSPGLGKSAQFIASVNQKPGKADIICPSFLRYTWAREITKWATGDFPTIGVVTDSANYQRVNWDADYLLVPDSMLGRLWVVDSLTKRNARHVAVDEAHRFKTPNASRTVSLFGGDNGKFRSPGLVYEAEHATLMSGTPMLNRAIELWPILYAMAPELIDFMPYHDFGFKYGGPVQQDDGRWKFLGSSHEAELKARIMGRFMQVIDKRDVLPDLPVKVRQAVIVDKDTRQADVVALDRETLDRFDGDFERPERFGEQAVLRHENGLAKVQWAAKFIAEILDADPDEKILVGAHHRDVVAGLAQILAYFRPAVINGGVDNDERHRIEKDFQTGGGRLIIANIDSANLGLTLTAATRVVFVEYQWTPDLNYQFEDRANRIGSEWSIFCQYIVLPNSIDESILTSNIIKDERRKKVIG